MSGQHRWAIGLATSTGILGLTVTSSLALLANRFVDEFSRPHELIDESEFTWGMPEPPSYPPVASQRALLFKTLDGTLLSGEFWAQAESAPTIVLCHGYRIARSHLRSVAALEYSFGYNVMLFDFRGHGASDSVATSGGNAEVRDLEAALTVASQQPETLPSKILIHGFSMGASVALLTPPHPEAAAIIADSPYATLHEILRSIVEWQLTSDSASWAPLLQPLRNAFHALSWATVAVGRVVFRLRFGHPLIARPDARFNRCHTPSTTRPPTPHY